MKPLRILKNIKIDKIGYGGVGVGILDNGKKVLVRGAILPDSIVNCRVTRKKNDFIEANVTELLSYDKSWVDAKPRCAHFNNPVTGIPEGQEHKVGCGGCKWQMMSENKQLEMKAKLIIDSFRIAQPIIDRIGMMPIIPCPKEYGYRNKIEFSFGKYISGKSIDPETQEANPKFISHQRNCGFHKQGEFSKVLDVDQCQLISDKMHAAYTRVKELCIESGLAVHDQKTHEGVFRHMVIREGVNTGHIMINLVIADQQLTTNAMQQSRSKLIERFKNDESIKKIVYTFLVSYNNGLADIVKGKDMRSEILFGDGLIYEKLIFNTNNQNDNHNNINDQYIIEGGEAKKISDGDSYSSNNSDIDQHEISFSISPFSFFQTNTLAAQLLFKKSAEMVGTIEGTILDLYCGAGTIGLSFLKMGLGNYVAGVEIVSEAIEDAKKNALINKLDQSSYFVAGKAEDLVFTDTQLISKLKNLGLLIVDPPRCGLDKKVITFIGDIKKTHNCKLLYISCNPVTLARDLMLLEAQGRHTQALQPVDMFPHTHHIENIAVLS